ncbi:MAG: spore cortex biosynthesis protein YabQ [Desulfotomaculum sp.]|nr:spore cortex biosynthesis protein YabQ [Desulfotomaculum sp.]
MLAGFLYDLYRVLVKLFKLKKWGVMLGDLLFWLILTPLVFVILLMGNWGEVRLYVFIGLSLGAVIYLKWCSGYIVPLIYKLINIFKKTLNLASRLLMFLWRFFCLPFRKVVLVFTVPLGLISKIVVKMWMKVRPFFKRVLKNKIKHIVDNLRFKKK